MKGPFYDGKPDTPADAFAHHGVKGMKWGVRKDRETSGRDSGAKDEKSAAKREKKAQVYDAQAQKAQEVIDKLNAKQSNWGYIQRNRQAQVKQLEQFRDDRKKDAKDVREGRLTDAQKKRLIQVGIVGGVVVAMGAYKYMDSGLATDHALRGREFITGQKHQWKKNDLLSKDLDTDDILGLVVKPVNPGFGDMGTKMNCRRCTFAYEMRRRGYDVKATKSVSATGQTAIGVHNALNPGGKNLPTVSKLHLMGRISREAIRNGVDNVDNPDPNSVLGVLKGGTWGKKTIGEQIDFQLRTGAEKSVNIFNALAENPNGARGELGVGWSMGGGHSMAWEIVKGRPTIFDNQTGKAYRSPKDFEEFADGVTAAGYTRLDNVPLNDAFLRRWIQDA